MQRRVLYRLTFLALALSLGHHLVRGNAVGWPVTSEVNAFTASLVVYPIIATGLLLYHAGRVGPGFWALVSGGGGLDLGFVAYRVVSVLPFLAAWTAACYALGRRLLPVMAPGGSSTPAPRLHSRGVQVQDLPELGTVDGIADLGFALAAWFIDPDYNWIGLLQLK